LCSFSSGMKLHRRIRYLAQRFVPPSRPVFRSDRGLWIALFPDLSLLTSNCGSAADAFAVCPAALAGRTTLRVTTPQVGPCEVFHSTWAPRLTDLDLRPAIARLTIVWTALRAAAHRVARFLAAASKRRPFAAMRRAAASVRGTGSPHACALSAKRVGLPSASTNGGNRVRP